MPTIPIYVLRDGALISTVYASSKYDAKQRKSRLIIAYPDCQIIIGDTNGTSQVSRTSDVENSGI